MADEQYRWLDRETAERLLRGEPLDNAVEAAALDEAERLAKTLGALSPDTPLSSTELPGEAAALAAFRTAREARGARERREEHEGREVREGRGGEQAAAGHRARSHASDGLVRIGGPDRRARRPRWGRPLRLGLAAALAAGMVGGVAVAAGTGVLPTPFDDAEPGPAASVSAAVTPDPLLSPSPNAPGGEPSSGTSGVPGQGSRRDTARGGSATGPSTGSALESQRNEHWREAASACRDIRDGKTLTTQRRRTLEGVAGGSARVWTYCKGVLTAAGEGSAGQDGKDGRDGKDAGGKDNGGKDNDGGSGRGSQQGKGEAEGRGGNGDGRRLAPGRGDDRDRSGDRDTPSSALPTLPRQSPTSPSASPSAPDSTR